VSASWVDKLNESDSRLHKEDVLNQALSAALLGNNVSDNFLTMIRACYNPFVTFGIKQVPTTSDITNAENPWESFAELLSTLALRDLTGNDAKDAVNAMSRRFDSHEWNTFCRPVLRKDLRAGISEVTINKICKKTKYEVPKFACQLATNSEGRPELTGKKRLEPKLDGVRVLMFVQSGPQYQVSAVSFSRNGKQFDNFGHIEDQVIELFRNYLPTPTTWHMGRNYNAIVIDGEIVGKTFQELMRQARRKTDVKADDSVFHIFDILPREAFLEGKWNYELSARLKILEKLRSRIDEMPNIELVPHIDVNLSTAEGRDVMHRYAKDMVNAGYEGIMIKDLDSIYQCKRTTSWMKWKPTITVDLEVVDIEEGTGRNEGRLGALVCEGVDDGKQIRVNVGSGYSDEDRDDYWKHKKKVVGRTVEVLCDAVTQNQDGSYSLRFPRFVRFRDDK